MKDKDNPQNTTLAFVTNKGGVAKTASAAAVGSALSRMGFKVLLIDVDGQGNLSNTFLTNVPNNNVADLLNDGIIPTVHIREGLDIIPCDMSIIKIEEAMTEPGDRLILKQRIAPLREQYDFIIIDCPPSFSRITVNAISAADYIFAPSLTCEDSKDGIVLLADTCLTAAPPKMIGGVFLTMYDGRPRVNREIEQEMRKKYGALILKSVIRNCVKVKEARKNHTDVISYAPKSNPAQDYTALANEILELIKSKA